MNADDGRRVADVAIDELASRLGPRLVSAYIIGSLAHGGYAPAVSDVDVAILVDHCTDELPTLVAIAVSETQQRLGPGLADRLSVFYADWESFSRPQRPARFDAVDRLDLMLHGLLVSGADRRATHGRVPTREELIRATRAFLTAKPLQPQDPAALVAQGPRPLTKAVLFPVRFLYTQATGNGGSNEDAGGWYCEARRSATPLVRATLHWRSGDVDVDHPVLLVAPAAATELDLNPPPSRREHNHANGLASFHCSNRFSCLGTTHARRNPAALAARISLLRRSTATVELAMDAAPNAAAARSSAVGPRPYP